MKIATITAVYNEKVLLPQFLAHYAPQVDTVFLIDNESDDGSLEASQPYNNIVISTYRTDGRFKYSAKHEAVERQRSACVDLYDYVMMVDVDEFIVSKSGKAIQKEIVPGQDLHWTHGYTMIPMPDDPPYNPKRSILENRSGSESFLYSKPVILKPSLDVQFLPGMHALKGTEGPSLLERRESPLMLLHYNALSEEFYVERCMVRAHRLSFENVVLGHSAQYHVASEDIFRKKFRDAQAFAEGVPIPQPFPQ